MGPPLAEKRAQLIHPPKSNFLKMEAAALIYLKTAAWPCYGRKRPSAITAVFFIPQGSTPYINTVCSLTITLVGFTRIPAC